MSRTDARERPWLLFIHQIPPHPSYLRAKIGRQLQRIGAVAIKNTVYALPRSDPAQEDLQWVLRETVAGGGEATICEVRFIDGLRDGEIEELFNRARDADYRELAEAARSRSRGPRAALRDAARAELESDLAKLKRRLGELASVDFFGAPARTSAEQAVARLEDRLRAREKPEPAPRSPAVRPEDYRRRVWVTRQGVHVDRMASAWLIRRFIDPEARFKFVPGRGYASEPKEVRFDMFEGEFTHEGDRCTFEVLVERMRLGDPALRPIAEIVHDIDLKDRRFEREETAGVARLVAGIAAACPDDDEERLARARTLFDGLYESFRRRNR